MLVAGAVLDFVYLSNDGGKSWKKQTLSSSMGVLGDPCIVSAEDGSFYYFHLPGNPRGTKANRSNNALTRSCASGHYRNACF
ncbi:MAG: hypothetical protein R3B47_15630 [Bacteroidia bacterium]